MQKYITSNGGHTPNSKEDICERALEDFREYLKPKKVIKSGKHFNVQLLIEAFKLYDKNFDAFGGRDSRKNEISLQKVIGYIERYLPACYAQAFCQRVYYIVEKGEKLNRSLEFCNDKEVYSFPLDLNSSYRSGYEYYRLGYEYAVIVGAAVTSAGHRSDS